MTLLQQIPASVRAKLYLALGLVVLAEGATAVGYSTAGNGLPTWLNVTVAVTSYVGGAIGFTAASNTPAPPAGD